MANLIMWYNTNLPPDIIQKMEEELQALEMHLSEAKVGDDMGLNETQVRLEAIRNNKNVWLPSLSWIGGYLWHFVSQANRENFRYDLESFENESLQYSVYEPGTYYGWHTDTTMSSRLSLPVPLNSGPSEERVYNKASFEGEFTRKLSVSVQLSGVEDYEGGQLQILDDSGNSFFAPKRKGTVIIFDSRVRHRVRPVTNGKRKSLVGWVVGPRWK